MAAFRITSVIIGTVAGKRHSIYRKTLTHYRIQLPHGTVFQSKTLKQHTFAPNRLNKIGSKIMARPEYPLFNRNAVLVHFSQQFSVLKLKIRQILRPGIFNLMMPVPPVCCICASVKYTRACYCNVMGIAGINQRRIIIAGRCLPMRKHQRIMLF